MKNTNKRAHRAKRSLRTVPARHTTTNKPGAHELREKLQRFAEENDWDAIIETLLPLIKHGTGHWMLVQLAVAYERKGAYEQSIDCAQEALWIEYDCPAARWIYGYALFHHGEYRRAVDMLEELIHRDEHKISHGSCGGGSGCNVDADVAETMINDARIIVAAAYYKLGYVKLYAFYRNIYVRKVSQGIATIFEDALEGLPKSDD